jgi:hypothetical protein
MDLLTPNGFDMSTRDGRKDCRPGPPALDTNQSAENLKKAIGDFYERVQERLNSPGYQGEISLSVMLFDGIPQQHTVTESQRHKHKDVK